MLFPDSRILIFCKAPVPGKVKKRLQPTVSPEVATELHVELSRRIISLAVETRLSPVELWCHPDQSHDFFQECQTTFDLTLHNQRGNDLGERMFQGFSAALEKADSAILLGCDCPSLTVSDLQEAMTALGQGEDVVMAPAEDGGYVLLGLRQPHKELFTHIDWGTPQVYAETCEQIAKKNLRLHELALQWDVDRPEDYQRYSQV